MGWIKLIHITCALFSFFSFFVRGIWMLSNEKMLQKKWVKISPHIIDTLLLLSAFLLLYTSHWSVFENTWLQIKIIALVVYIGLGVLALKPGRPKSFRFVAWVTALGVFLLIVYTALTKPDSISALTFGWII